MRPYWVWVGPKFIRTGVLKRKGKLGHRDTDAQGSRPWTGRGRGWEWCIHKLGAARLAGNHQKPEETRKDPPLGPLEKAWPRQYLDF